MKPHNPYKIWSVNMLRPVHHVFVALLFSPFYLQSIVASSLVLRLSVMSVRNLTGALPLRNGLEPSNKIQRHYHLVNNEKLKFLLNDNISK